MDSGEAFCPANAREDYAEMGSARGRNRAALVLFSCGEENRRTAAIECARRMNLEDIA
jgi:hypothetical protein